MIAMTFTYIHGISSCGVIDAYTRQHCLLPISLSYMIVHLSTISQDGISPLFMASQMGHTKTVNILLKNGADPNLARTVSIAMI